jgi:hypothetical protein
MKAVHKRRRRLVLPRAEWLGVVTGLLALGLLAGLAVLVVDMAQDRRADHAVIDALTRQVQGLGGTPVAGPTGAQGEPGMSVTGEPGEKGEKGDAGESGKPAPTLSPSPGASGASGAPGKPGADSTVPGPSGAPGADSTVPGPSGAPGVAGRDGADGADGKPPAGWTWTDRFGDTYTCVPVEGFDPAAPRYTCPPSEPPPDDGPGNGQPQSLALDPQRRQYV